ncbi:hypothetical protein PF001_g27886 [Phytophthora fragariae]|uniref:Uncharacterized protein n=1 Tax=Phytophthora fragariae TaxID=53985 RepID=A0A6A4BCB4_9STRA|nr:hypothetical protein PF001_g27886 [Phytophthora fragariae]
MATTVEAILTWVPVSSTSVLYSDNCQADYPGDPNDSGIITLGDNRTSIACLCPEAGRRRRRAQVRRWGRTLPRSCMREQIRANLPSCNAH